MNKAQFFTKEKKRTALLSHQGSRLNIFPPRDKSRGISIFCFRYTHNKVTISINNSQGQRIRYPFQQQGYYDRGLENGTERSDPNRTQIQNCHPNSHNLKSALFPFLPLIQIPSTWIPKMGLLELIFRKNQTKKRE